MAAMRGEGEEGARGEWWRRATRTAQRSCCLWTWTYNPLRRAPCFSHRLGVHHGASVYVWCCGRSA